MSVRTIRIEEDVVPGRRLGRHVEHDERSLGFAVEEAPAETIGPVSHRRFGMLNQGQLGSCTGNAMAGALNSRPLRVGTAKLLVEDDAVRLYSEATRIDGIQGIYPPDDTGSSGLAVSKAAKREGRISGYKWALSTHAALSALMSVPVITGVPWFEGFDHPDSSGLVKIAGQIRGGHEFEIVGFEPAASNGPLLDGIVEAVNSWGYSFGVRGRFRFTARTLDELLADNGDVTVPVPL